MQQFTTLGPFTKHSILLTFLLISFFTVLFYTWYYLTKKEFLKTLISRVNSWWVIFLIVTLMISFDRIYIFIGFACISFLAFRELTSKLSINVLHRRTLMLSYISIPIQYYFAYTRSFIPFLIFIPVGMLLLLPFRSILEDVSEDSIKTFSQLQWVMMLCVFSLSHVSYFASLPMVDRFNEKHQGMIFFLILITQLNDVSQFISGKLFGTRKISPLISPNKTWAGLIGGIIGSMMFGFIFKNLLPFSLIQTLFLSSMVSISGFFGDLNISAIKRDLNIKDMSNLIPGHGGILDRVDSLIFSNLVYFYICFFWMYN